MGLTINQADCELCKQKSRNTTVLWGPGWKSLTKALPPSGPDKKKGQQSSSQHNNTVRLIVIFPEMIYRNLKIKLNNNTEINVRPFLLTLMCDGIFYEHGTLWNIRLNPTLMLLYTYVHV